MTKIIAVVFAFFVSLAISGFAQYWPTNDFMKTDSNAKVQAAKIEQAQKKFEYKAAIERHELNIKSPDFFGRGARQGTKTVEADLTAQQLLGIYQGDLAVSLLAFKPYIKVEEDKLARISKKDPFGFAYQQDLVNKLKVSAKSLNAYYNQEKFLKSSKTDIIKLYSLVKILRLAFANSDSELITKTVARIEKI